MGILTRTRSGWSIQWVLLLLLISTLVPVLLIQAGIYLNQLQTRRNEELQSNLELARAVASAFDGYVQNILDQELVLGTALSAKPAPSPEHARRLLAIAARAYPTMLRFNWIDPHGRIIMSSEARAVNLTVVDRQYYQAIIAGNHTIVSDLYQARVAGEPVFAIARGVYDSQGHLLGIIAGLVDPTRLDQILALQRLGDGSIVINDRQGWLVYRHPKRALGWEQRRPGGSWILKRTLAGEEVKGILLSRYDGKSRMGSSTPVRSINWAVAATRPVESVMGPIAHRLYWDFGILLVVIVVVLLFALHLSNIIVIPINRLRTHARAVGQGQLSHQAEEIGPHELRELTKAFNEMTRQLQTRDDEREVYIQTISHDLRNPLTIVQANAEFLQQALRKSTEYDQAQASAEAIRMAAHRINVMTKDLLDFAYLEAGQFTVSPIHLPQFIPALLERCRMIVAAERIRGDIPAELPAVSAHADRLERILLNLLTNALKYSSPDTPITVTAAPRNGMVEIAIANRGNGIDPDDLPHIFNRFYRSKRTNDTEGLGLGLYIAKMLVEAHRGHIRVENTVGDGCTFYFTLPTV